MTFVFFNVMKKQLMHDVKPTQLKKHGKWKEKLRHTGELNRKKIILMLERAFGEVIDKMCVEGRWFNDLNPLGN